MRPGSPPSRACDSSFWARTKKPTKKPRDILAQTYPGLQIVGRRHGYFSRLEEDDICDEINLTRPDVIWVGLSVPLEYEFAVRNRGRLKAGWLVTCGGCFNFVTGAYARAPALDAGGRPGMAASDLARTQTVVLALCDDQSACDFPAFDAHKGASPGSSCARPDGTRPHRGLRDLSWFNP